MTTKNIGRQKSRPKSPGVSPNFEIIPGRLNDIEWNQIMENQEENSFINALVKEIIDSAERLCYQNTIESSVIPFTVTMAKDALDHIIRWNFICRDEGEVESPDHILENDREVAVPCKRDNWAQACTKSVCVESLHEKSVEKKQIEIIKNVETPVEELEEIEEQPQATVVQEEVVQPKAKVVSRNCDKNKTNRNINDQVEKENEQTPTIGTHSSQSTKDKKFAKYWPSDGAPKFLSSHIFKTLPSRTNAKKEVIFDDQGNITYSIKVEPKHVIDQRHLPVINSKENRKSRPIEEGREYCLPQSKLTKEKVKKKASVSVQSSEYTREEALTQLTFLDHIQPVPGTVVTEGKRSKRGQELSLSKQGDDHEGIVLKPVANKPWKPKFSISEITKN